MDEHLTAAGASWDPDPTAGEWIGALLDGFGPTLGHAVPAGYEAHAVIPIPWGDEILERQDYRVLEALLEVLAPFTGEQVVHTAFWEGWGWMYDRDEDPRTALGMGVLIVGAHDEEAVRAAREEMARRRIARPDAPPLVLPERNYFLWSGPLSSAAALRHTGDIPSLIWPDDRSWFIGAPIYTSEIAVGADEQVIRAVLEAPSLGALGARRAERGDVLQGDG
ncbi:hypothetical protein GCM10027064_17210 [Microbacterium petrolearium]